MEKDTIDIEKLKILMVLMIIKRKIINLKTVYLAWLFLLISFTGLPIYRNPLADILMAQEYLPDEGVPVEKNESFGITNGRKYYLEDFFAQDEELDEVVNLLMDKLTDEEKISQMVISYFTQNVNPSDVVLDLILNKKTGGVIFFEDSADEINYLTEIFNDAARSSSSVLLPIFAIDGEPSFIRYQFGLAGSLPMTSRIETEEESRRVAETIALILKDMGLHINYAPVCDISFNREIIGNRSFGSDIEMVSVLSYAFIESTQAKGIVATAKHFPGHGSVRGDTHKGLIFVEGKPPELPVFRYVIENGVISVMVGHIGVRNHDKYETGGKPSSLSRNIVTGLLKNELGFKGIVVTDAMKMEAVRSFSMPSYEAARAGCDMILMPDDERLFIRTVQKEIQIDEMFRHQIMDSVRKIIRLKVCLGLINDAEDE